MNIISKALDEIKYRIPFEILQLVFSTPTNWRTMPISIDESIRNKVIYPRVLVDCNLVGGVQVIIATDGLTFEVLDNYIMAFAIPPDRRMHRSIVSVLSVGFMPYSSVMNGMGGIGGNVAMNNTNEISNVAQRVMDSYNSFPPITTASAELIGENTIAVKDSYRPSGFYSLRCIVENEANLNNINPRSYHHFSELVTLATKAYIYNTLVVALDKGYLTGGQELSIIKSIIDEYRDSGENYLTYLRETWAAVAVCNDRESYDRLLRMQISPGL